MDRQQPGQGARLKRVKNGVLHTHEAILVRVRHRRRAGGQALLRGPHLRLRGGVRPSSVAAHAARTVSLASREW